MRVSVGLVATVLGALPILALPEPSKEPPKGPYQAGNYSIYGCYSGSASSIGELTHVLTNKYMTPGLCHDNCVPQLKPVGAVNNGTECWCGSSYPPDSRLADDSKCNWGCGGWDTSCGGYPEGSTFYYTVINTGLFKDVPTSADEPSSSSSPGGSSPTASSPAASSAPSGGSSSAVGIAVGVVVAILVVAGIAGGIFFYKKKKRNQEMEDDHRRNVAINSFVNGSRVPSSSGTDSRLDPVMAQRRMSDGSIADNQDYSRKILRVTNA